MRLRRGVMVLHRAPGVTQVGLAKPAILTNLTAEDQRLLALLEGGRISPERLSSGAIGQLSALDLYGHLLDEVAPQHQEESPTVVIYGAGDIGMAAARCLARHRHPIEFEDGAPAVAESPGVYRSPGSRDTCAAAATRDVLASVPGATVRVGASAPHAAIVIGVGAADPVAWWPLARADVPHVLVATDEGGVDVGPLVMPGATACARCVELEHAERDSAWPVLRLQCGPSRRPVVAPHVAESAGALAAAMLLALGPLRAARSPEVDDAAWAVNAIWRVEPGRPPTARPALPHPDCGCGAAELAATSAISSAP